ncbi:hypothetical protein NPX13_g8516 [Xylaria arbuscula]|uniref:Uncharacterized protein n=1 Tax=Xylaria arbuscula TaxID=114810 RepID=A0A9W8N8A1_9PEZI|nr:hypothetical protein NPX13_g8516 [Xylaria arbuscula]
MREEKEGRQQVNAQKDKKARSQARKVVAPRSAAMRFLTTSQLGACFGVAELKTLPSAVNATTKRATGTHPAWNGRSSKGHSIVPPSIDRVSWLSALGAWLLASYGDITNMPMSRVPALGCVDSLDREWWSDWCKIRQKKVPKETVNVYGGCPQANNRLGSGSVDSVHYPRSLKSIRHFLAGNRILEKGTGPKRAEASGSGVGPRSLERLSTGQAPPSLAGIVDTFAPFALPAPLSDSCPDSVMGARDSTSPSPISGSVYATWTSVDQFCGVHSATDDRDARSAVYPYPEANQGIGRGVTTCVSSKSKGHMVVQPARQPVSQSVLRPLLSTTTGVDVKERFKKTLIYVVRCREFRPV